MKVDIEMTQEELNKVTELARPAQGNPVLELLPLLMMATFGPNKTSASLADVRAADEKKTEEDKDIPCELLARYLEGKYMTPGHHIDEAPAIDVMSMLMVEGLLHPSEVFEFLAKRRKS